MDTDRLIRTLAADSGSAGLPMARATWIAGGAAVLIAAAVFFLAIGPRPDFAEAAGTARFLFKFIATLALLFAAFASFRKLARPGASSRRELTALIVAPALLLVAVAAEVSLVSPDELSSRWIGTNAYLCLTFIPLIGIGPLAVYLALLRHAAPTRPALAGAVSGLVAGGIAATLYAAHCIDDSPLFVATWYPLAILPLVLLGTIAGRTLARW